MKLSKNKLGEVLCGPVMMLCPEVWDDKLRTVPLRKGKRRKQRMEQEEWRRKACMFHPYLILSLLRQRQL